MALGAKNKRYKEDLPNFYKVNSDIYRGGQPTEAGIKTLAKLGVKTIIYLRDGKELAKAEEKWAADAGIKFIHEPEHNWRKPKRKSIESIIETLTTAENQPVFVHCRRGADRTGTVIATYRITRDGWTAKQANAEAKKFGFGWWQVRMKDFIKDYYRDFKKNGELSK